MSVYVVAHIDIADRARYSTYESGFLAIFAAYDGEIIAVDDEPVVLEGELAATRCVILRFPDHEAVMAWYRSDEYQELAVERWAASDGTILMVESLS